MRKKVSWSTSLLSSTTSKDRSNTSQELTSITTPAKVAITRATSTKVTITRPIKLNNNIIKIMVTITNLINIRDKTRATNQINSTFRSTRGATSHHHLNNRMVISRILPTLKEVSNKLTSNPGIRSRTKCLCLKTITSFHSKG